MPNVSKRREANARLYDPALGRFLSPDPYVQMPDFSQNFNRYSYCLNNPLVYVDEDGEFWHIVIGAIIGGVGNLIANWNHSSGFWEHFTSFLVGAGAGAATAATGGAAGATWSGIAGVSAAGSAVVGTTNSVIAQTGTNFEGFNKVDWGLAAQSGAIGGVAGFAGGSAGYWAANASTLVNNVSSPILRSAIVSPLAAGAGHVAGGTTANLFAGQNLGDAFANSFNGIGSSMIVGGAMGVASTVAVSYANNVNPWTGKELESNNTTDFFEGTKYSPKVLQQMNEDSFHGFPESVKAFQQDGYITHITGGDNVIRTQLHIPCSYKGYDGEFLFLKEPNGIINHRIFQPYKY